MAVTSEVTSEREREKREKIDQILKIWGSLIPKGYQAFYIKIELAEEKNVKNIVNFILNLFQIYSRNRTYEYALVAETWFFGKRYLSMIILVRWFPENEISWKNFVFRIVNEIEIILKIKVAKVFNGFLGKLVRTGSYLKFLKILKRRVTFFFTKFRKMFFGIIKTNNISITKHNKEDEKNMSSITSFIENIEKKLLSGFT